MAACSGRDQSSAPAGLRDRTRSVAPYGSCAAAARCSPWSRSSRGECGVASGWAGHPGGRHHGGAGSRLLGVSEGELLDFSQNINPLGAPAAALEAARRALGEEAGRYPSPGYPQLREALAMYLGLPRGNILPTNGGAEALFLAARAA